MTAQDNTNIKYTNESNENLTDTYIKTEQPLLSPWLLIKIKLHSSKQDPMVPNYECNFKFTSWGTSKYQEKREWTC